MYDLMLTWNLWGLWLISVHAGGLVNKKAVLLVLGQSLPAPGEGKRERKGERERERKKKITPTIRKLKSASLSCKQQSKNSIRYCRVIKQFAFGQGLEKKDGFAGMCWICSCLASMLACVSWSFLCTGREFCPASMLVCVSCMSGMCKGWLNWFLAFHVSVILVDGHLCAPSMLVVGGTPVRSLTLTWQAEHSGLRWC